MCSASRPCHCLQLSAIGHEAFAQTVGVLRGSSLAQRQAHGQRLSNAPVTFVAQVLKREGEVLACGQFAREGNLVGLYDVFTVPSARGRGLARLLCSLASTHPPWQQGATLRVEREKPEHQNDLLNLLVNVHFKHV